MHNKNTIITAHSHSVFCLTGKITAILLPRMLMTLIMVFHYAGQVKREPGELPLLQPNNIPDEKQPII